MKILSLNIQGLGQKAKKEWIKEINFKHNINFLTLQETKMDKISHMDIKFIWGNSNYQFVVSDRLGTRGVFYVYGNLQFLSRIMPLYQITSLLYMGHGFHPIPKSLLYRSMPLNQMFLNAHYGNISRC